ncbi:universal stress protein [Planctomycetes bacterium K23_9]|uniref:Universal stress protein n=1 Tax=Stieleria marina TaxID=1930275 RepID=A0A517NXA4_9BACT|nr:Universal stress protein [Planctomycetes bacterium K23_9]
MKVLLATDGSAAATEAVKFVRSLADYNSVDAVVVTVSYDPEHYSKSYFGQPWLADWTEQENDRTQAILDQAKQTLDETCQSVKTIHGTGATLPFLLNQAKVDKVDLIVMGAKGHSAIGRILLGSISDSIASRAECSVVIIRPSDNGTVRPERVVLGYDRSIASREAVAELMEWNLRRDTKVDVVSVVQNPYVYAGDGYIAEPITVRPEQIAEVNESAQRMASQVAEHFPHTEAHSPTADHVGDAIVKVAEKNKADMIVVGDAGHSLLGELLLGSTSKYVLRHAPCSVWISRHHYKLDPSNKEVDDVAAAS